jgi:predicted amidohydrolase YtcJ
MESLSPVASVIATLGSRIVYVGDDRQKAKQSLPPSFETIDLTGLTVIPGLIDSHAHVLHEGLRLSQLDLKGLGFNETLLTIEDAARKLPPGAWLHGRAWDQNIWADRDWPTLTELDKVAPLNPVVLERVDKHAIWVNSKALELADPKVFGPDPPGGEIRRLATGQPSGVLIGPATRYVYEVMPPLDGQDRGQTLELAQKELLGYGLTTVVDAATGEADLAVLMEGYEKERYKIRFRAYIHPRQWRNWGKLTRVNGLYDDHLAIDGLKVFSDGSLGSRSAWLFEDYSDCPGKRGAEGIADEPLNQALLMARDKALQVAIHVIGDAAVAQAVTGVTRVLGRGWTDRRWRLEHCQVVRSSDRDQIIAMGLIPSIQSVGLMTDWLMAEERLGPDRLRRAYAWRDFLDRGAYIINGSDCPVETANPFVGLYAAICRLDTRGQPEGGFCPQHKLSRWEALASYTLWGARAAFQEGQIGSLRPGALADFVVLDRDILSCPLELILGTRALLTVVGGETVQRSF